MTILRDNAGTLLALVTVLIAVGYLTSPATAQRTPLPIADGDRRSITTSTAIGLLTGENFHWGGVHVPSCPNGTAFMATAMHASPSSNNSTAALVNLPMWEVSALAFQVAANGSFTAALTVFGDGPAHASASIPGGQPLGNEDNVIVQLVGGAEAGTTTFFTVHVTGYCGVPFVGPA